MLRLTLFVIFSALLLIFTLRRSFQHRWFRFLSFESLLALVILNADHWFQNPISPRQIFSWLFLIASLLLALHGFRILRVAGKPEDDFEKTTQLVKAGAYRYIRHPLYASLLLLGVGAFLKNPSWLGSALLAALFIFCGATARVEERENLERFGEIYRDYMGETKMFIPLLF